MSERTHAIDFHQDAIDKILTANETKGEKDSVALLWPRVWGPVAVDDNIELNEVLTEGGEYTGCVVSAVVSWVGNAGRAGKRTVGIQIISVSRG